MPLSAPTPFRRLVTNSYGWQDSILNHATSTYQFLGYDATDSRAFIKDSTGGILRQATTTDAWITQGNATFSTSKSVPTNTTYAGIQRMLRFGSKIYAVALDTSDSLYKVWNCDPASGNNAFSWSSPLKSMASGATAFYTSLVADSSYIYLAEYGDPSGGPSLYRSSDGTSWSTVYTDATARHIHAVMPDPYNQGHLWMTQGDGISRTVLKSVDYGSNWSVVIVSSAWQAVQISFSANWVWLAGDSARGHLIIVDRATGTPYFAGAGQAKNIAVPAGSASTDRFYGNGWIGCVDPAAEVYYFVSNDTSSSGNTFGLFAVTRIGEAPILIDKLATVAGPVDIAGGVLWAGKTRRPLFTVLDI